MAMIFSLGTKSHDVFVFKNLVDSYKESNFKSLDELQNIVYSNSESEFDIDLYNNAVSLPAAQSVQFSFDTSVSAKYKYGAFNGKNRYKDVSGIIDTSTTYSKPINGWLTLDKSSNDYGLFSTLDNDTFYIAVKDFSPGLIVSDFRPLYYKLMSLQLSKYNSPSNDTCSAYSGVVSFKQAISDLVSGIKNKSVLSFNSLVDSKYFSLKTVTDAAYDAEMAASKITKFGKFLQTASGDDVARKIVDEVPILNELKSTGLSVYKSLNSIKSSFGEFSDGYNPTSNNVADKKDEDLGLVDSSVTEKEKEGKVDNKLNQLENKKINDKNIGQLSNTQGKDSTSIEWIDPSIQAVIYAINSNKTTYEHDEGYMLACLQQPEQISYSIDSQYDTQSTRGSQTPYQFYQSTGQVTLSFELKWHIDEVLSQTNSIIGSKFNHGTQLQSIADIAEDFARPWDNNNGSIEPKLCRVILPSISEVGYINNVSITYSGDMATHTPPYEYENIRSRMDSVYTADTALKESPSLITDYTYNMLTINFSLLVIRDVKLTRYKRDPEPVDYGDEFDFSDDRDLDSINQNESEDYTFNESEAEQDMTEFINVTEGTEAVELRATEQQGRLNAELRAAQEAAEKARRELAKKAKPMLDLVGLGWMSST